MNDDSQLDFDFSAAADDAAPDLPREWKGLGYQHFTEERRAAIESIKTRYGIMLGDRVRLKLIGWEQEFCGKLILDTLLLPKSKKGDLPLRIGRVTFERRDIEYCILLDKDE
jgi:hypothetical protein